MGTYNRAPGLPEIIRRRKASFVYHFVPPEPKICALAGSFPLTISQSLSVAYSSKLKAMATLAAAAARKVASLTSISSPKTPIQAANLIQRRGLAGAAGNFIFLLCLCIFRSHFPVDQNLSNASNFFLYL